MKIWDRLLCFLSKKWVGGLIAAYLGYKAYMAMPTEINGAPIRSLYFVHFCGFLLLAFGIYGYYNIREHQINGDSR